MSGVQPPITPNKTGTLQHLLKKKKKIKKLSAYFLRKLLYHLNEDTLCQHSYQKFSLIYSKMSVTMADVPTFVLYLLS